MPPTSHWIQGIEVEKDGGLMAEQIQRWGAPDGILLNFNAQYPPVKNTLGEWVRFSDHEAAVARESERADKAEAKLSEIGKLVGYWEHEKPIRGSALQALEAARKATQGCADDLRSLLPGNEGQEASDAH